MLGNRVNKQQNRVNQNLTQSVLLTAYIRCEITMETSVRLKTLKKGKC